MFLAISGKHLNSVMAVPSMNGCLVLAVLSLSQSLSLGCDREGRRRTSGLYCHDVNGSVSLIVPAHECTLLCIQRSKCIATNYNSSDGTCQLLPATCLQASEDPSMTHTIFSRVNSEQCLEWMDHYEWMPADERRVMTKVGGDGEQRVMARMIYGGEYYPSHYYPRYDKCFCTNGSLAIKSSRRVLCQILRMREGCTMAFMSYTAGDVLPVGALAVPNLLQHKSRYIAAIEMPSNNVLGRVVAGWYTIGADHAMYAHNGIKTSTEMKLMVVLQRTFLYIKWYCHQSHDGTFKCRLSYKYHIDHGFDCPSSHDGLWHPITFYEAFSMISTLDICIVFARYVSIQQNHTLKRKYFPLG